MTQTLVYSDTNFDENTSSLTLFGASINDEIGYIVEKGTNYFDKLKLKVKCLPFRSESDNVSLSFFTTI